MNSDDLALFAAVVDAGSILRSAIERGADQSTISRRIATLEAEMGGRLFHRSGRGVVPTERGKELLRYAHKVTETIDEAFRVMRQGLDKGPSRLRIGAFQGVIRPMTPSGSRVISTSTPGRTEGTISPPCRNTSPAKK